LLHLAGKMLENDPLVNSLLQTNPFRGREPPKHIRIRHYKYSFANGGGKEWWKRRLWKEYLQPVGKRELKEIYKQYGWKFKK
jgi:hypothetical protein